MYEKDYVMRLIKEMVRTLIKLLFNIDTEVAEERLREDSKSGDTLNKLYDMIDEGNICDAENMLYTMLEEGADDACLIGALVYSYMNDKSDEFLTEHNFSRGEIEEGLKNLAERCGTFGITEVFDMKNL